MAVATHVAMLRDRRIIFYGTPQEMTQTENEYVRDFID
jgi:ABC-type transporter Mla maintaining outer membrane lipid asymmetry ATPase subunit MlaF